MAPKKFAKIKLPWKEWQHGDYPCVEDAEQKFVAICTSRSYARLMSESPNTLRLLKTLVDQVRIGIEGEEPDWDEVQDTVGKIDILLAKLGLDKDMF
jgi:hypothetical protein